jgi:hypothetical protein
LKKDFLTLFFLFKELLPIILFVTLLTVVFILLIILFAEEAIDVVLGIDGISGTGTDALPNDENIKNKINNNKDPNTK